MLEKTDVSRLGISPVDMFGKYFSLLTAGTAEKFNTMTIGWGTLGCLWNKPFVSVYVRPSRYTYEFIEENELFTVSCFGERMKKEIGLLGTKSGRDINKMDVPGLTPVILDGAPAYEEAETVIVCRKAYRDVMEQRLIGEYLRGAVTDRFYSGSDGDNWHVIYYGEVISAYERS